MSLFEDASLIVTPNGFKAGKLYSIKPTNGDGDLNVVRATTATRVNSVGLIETVANNVPRIDYTNGSCPSVLVEPQRTNLLLRSEEFDNAGWVKTAVTTVSGNTFLAPDNSLTADTLSDQITLVNGTYVVTQTINFTSGTVYTGSVYAKNIDRRYIYIRFPSAAFTFNLFAFFDLQLGVVVTQSSGVTAKIEVAPNGFYRCIATATATITASATFFSGLSLTGLSNVYINSAVASVILWGAQLEAGANATSYIPTVASAVTRNADLISKTGIADLIGQSEGTLFVEFNSGELDANQYFLGINTNVSNRIIIFKQSNNTIQAQVRKNNVVQTTLSSSTITENTDYKVAISYQEDNVNFYINGFLIGTDTLAKIPTCSNLTLDDGGGQRNFYRPLKSILLFKTRLTNAQLEALTTL